MPAFRRCWPPAGRSRPTAQTSAFGRAGAIALLLALAPLPARGQTSAPSRAEFTWANDLFAGRDGHYTNGGRVAVAGAASPRLLPGPLLADELEWGLSLTQVIYTPADIRHQEVIPGDRSYAGWMSLGLSLRRRNHALRYEDRLELALGVVGPASAAEAIQSGAHETMGIPSAQGWDHQLPNEPTVQLSYRLMPRLARGAVAGLTYDLTGRVGLTVGNVATHAGVGLRLRVGLRVPDPFAPVAGPPPSLRVYLLASAQARLVAHDMFLDGSLLRSGSPRLEKELGVAELSAGLTVTICDGVSVTYRHTYRTPQFRGQVRGDAFGSISVAVAW